MELVYLWIENYKNIEKQGFTFSPRFDCKYDPETNILEINEKKDYVNIFPDNINVTAIVGKNGAGKSNLLHLIIGSFYNNHKNWRKIKNSLLVFKNDSKFIIYHLYNNTDKSIRVSCNNFEYILRNYLDDNLKKVYYLLIDFSISQPNIYNSSNYKKFYSLEPSRFYKTSGGGSIYSKIEPSSFDSNMKVNLIYFYWYLFKYNLIEILEDFNLPFLKQLKCFSKKNIGKVVKEKYFKHLKELKAKVLGFDFEKMENFNEINCFKRIIDLEELNENDFNYLEDLLIFLDIELVNANSDLYFYKMSTGQQYLLSYFGLLLRYYVSKYKNDSFKNAIVLIDEVESALHPQWQKNFLFYILNFINKLKLNDFFKQIIIATHSPFILSDMPKENIIFMKDGKNVSDGVDIETFGGNIHTLLTHGFFMEDGLMGEYAKEKINEVINYIRVKKGEKNLQTSIKDDKEAEFIINCIGEPFLKEKLKEIFFGTLSELDILKKRKEELEKRIRELENVKSK